MKRNVLKRTLIMLGLSIGIISIKTTPAMAEEVALPVKYDSRDYGCITSKKNQYGATCWAFASIAAAESSLIRTGLADSSIDLSEFHLAYYMDHNFHDPL